MYDLTFSPETIAAWYQDKPSTTFDDLIGTQERKALLRRELDGFLNSDDPASAQCWFLYGLPGTGKTLSIRAIVRELMEAGYRCLSLNAVDLMSSYVGEAERKIPAAFQEAMDNAPCVLVFDDLELVCPDRRRPNIASHQLNLTIAFLMSMNTLLRSGKQVLLLTASSRPEEVDEVFYRRARCISLSLPDEDCRKQYFAKAFENLILEEGFTIDDMAARTEGRSYRDLNCLTEDILFRLKDAAIMTFDHEQAAIAALKDGRLPATRAMFEQALRERPLPDKESWLAQLRDFEAQLQI